MNYHIEEFGAYRVLLTDNKGIISMEILHNKHGIVYSHADGGQFSDFISLAKIQISEMIENQHTLDTVTEMNVEAIHKGMVIATDTYFKGDEEVVEWISTDTDATIVYGRFDEPQDVYNYALNHGYTGWARYVEFLIKN